MLQIKLIERSLETINQAKFQDLMNHFLHLKGFIFISAPGSVVGKEKTSKGHPDSFFLDRGNYAFVEYTTQENAGKSFMEKLCGDIGTCFDEETTTIKAEKIKKVILACTDKIIPRDFDVLRELVQQYNDEAELELYDIQNLPIFLVDYPGLTERYLGITISKGEIISLHDFLEKTTKGVQPSLTNPFLYREEELKSANSALDTCDVLILSGKQGTGKSKLATVIANNFQGDGFIPVVIQSSGIPLWDNLPNLLLHNKDYMIIFDDANKAVNNLEYLLSYMSAARKGKIKLIITVRDYVRSELNKLLFDKRYRELIIEPLKDKELSEIVRKAVPVLEHYSTHTSQIVEMAKGNPRVALMAAYSLRPGADINYLESPVSLYQKYFEKVSAELELFKDKKPMQALAIVSFFGVVERANEKIKLALEKFGIDWNELWDTLIFLHHHELADIYQNQICKISDQVLATYAFYQTLINPETATIAYEKWVLAFMEKYEKRVKRSLIDINNTFGYKLIRNQTASHLDNVRAAYSQDEEKLYQFYKIYWYYKETATLIYLRKWIEALPTETVAKLNFEFQHNDHVYPSYKFDLLVSLWNDPLPSLRPALSLALQLIFKQPSRIPEVLKFLSEDLCYRRIDLETDFQRQKDLITILFEEGYSADQQKIVDGLFLKVSKVLLSWEHTEHTSSKGREITITNFHLVKSSELMALRHRIISRLTKLHRDHRTEVMKSLAQYSAGGRKFDYSIYIDEMSLLQQLIEDQFEPSDYNHCKFVKRLIKIFEKQGFSIPDMWQKFNSSELLRLAEIFKADVEERTGLSRDQIRAMRTDKLKILIKNKSWEEIKRQLENIEILSIQQIDDASWWISPSATEIFILLAEDSQENFMKAFELLLGKPLQISVQPGYMVNNVIQSKLASPYAFYSMISKYKPANPLLWKLNFFHALPEKQIDVFFTNELISSILSVSNDFYMNGFSELIKYDKCFQEIRTYGTHNIVSYLIEVLLEKSKVYRIDFGFQCCQECAIYLKDHPNILKQMYFNQRSIDRHFDFGGKELASIMHFDVRFFSEYLSQRDEDYLMFKMGEVNPSFIWELDSYSIIVNEALTILSKKTPFVTTFDHPANALFKNIKADDKKKAICFISDFIRDNNTDIVKMKIIINVIVHTFPDKLLDLLKQFLLVNKNVEIAKEFDFEKGGVFRGSRVPIIQKQIDLHNEILAMVKIFPKMLDYTDHILHWERQIEGMKREIRREQQHDFKKLFE